MFQHLENVTRDVLRRVVAAVGTSTLAEMPDGAWPVVGRRTVDGREITDNVHVVWSPKSKPTGGTVSIYDIVTDRMVEYPETEMLPLDEQAIQYIAGGLIDGIRARGLTLFVKPELPPGAYATTRMVNPAAGLAIRGWLDRPEGRWLLRFDIFGARG